MKKEIIGYCLHFLFALLLVMMSCNEPLQEGISLKQELKRLDIDPNELSLLIDKSDYSLSVVHKDTLIRTYPVVLGGNPLDDKIMEGDKCTPEGVFTVRNLYPHTSWSKFIWIDYPTEDSWRKFNAAKAAGDIPEDATIGGEIGIHGVPDNDDSLIENKVNWTLGCISLTNADVDELYEVSFKGMKVEIRN